MHHITKPLSGPATEEKTQRIDENQEKPSKEVYWPAKEDGLLPFSENFSN